MTADTAPTLSGARDLDVDGLGSIEERRENIVVYIKVFLLALDKLVECYGGSNTLLVMIYVHGRQSSLCVCSYVFHLRVRSFGAWNGLELF